MPFLYNINLGEFKRKKLLLSENELKSLLYHSIFDYPLTSGELAKWAVGPKAEISIKPEQLVEEKNGLYFLKGREGVVYKRLLKKRISRRKINIAKDAAKLLSIIPSIKMIAITGSLAMENAPYDSDIDLLLLTANNTLWTTRALALLLLKLAGFPVRRFGDKKQKDKLCMNMWIDEKALSWPLGNRNVYTAHEIAQIKPLINKCKAYERFMGQNKWIEDYWPNSVKLNHEPRTMNNAKKSFSSVVRSSFSVVRFFEKFAFQIQYIYMKKKITREKIDSHRAIFHPNDWGEVVLRQLTS